MVEPVGSDPPFPLLVWFPDSSLLAEVCGVRRRLVRPAVGGVAAWRQLAGVVALKSLVVPGDMPGGMWWGVTFVNLRFTNVNALIFKEHGFARVRLTRVRVE